MSERQVNHQKNDKLTVGDNIRLDQISPPGFQPRKYLDEEAMAKLIASIQQHGILQPILVRPFVQDEYELVAA